MCTTCRTTRSRASAPKPRSSNILPPAARGEKIGAWLLTEPHAGSDTAAIRTSARREGDTFVLNGTKQFISNGSEAGVAMVVAVTDPAAGKRGVTAFILDTATPGTRCCASRTSSASTPRTPPRSSSTTSRCRSANVLGDDRWRLCADHVGLADGRIAIAAQAVGVAQAALDAAVRYAREREAYGAPIMNLQAVSFSLAEMATRIEAARQLYRHAARMLRRLPCNKEASMAKLFASEMAERVCSDALQVHGGYGYLNDFPVERYCRDVRVCKIYEGTSDIQKLIISRTF
jgi:alkylation response protein AidB-like acyl-CoA dehydrogenase